MSGLGRKRVRNQNAEDASDEPVQINRQNAMAEVARRRAAHFAHFRDDDPDNVTQNVHTGGNEARNLGPWSSAAELIRDRDEQAAAREGKLQRAQQAGVSGVETGGDGAAKDEFASWRPLETYRPAGTGAFRARARVPALYDLCVDLLADLVDCIESLEGIPGSIRTSLAASVSRRGKITPEVALLFAEHDPGEIALPCCVELDSHAMTQLLRACVGSRLERLSLRFCGRGLGSREAAALATRGPLPQLRFLEAAGAYRLSNEGVEKLLFLIRVLFAALEGELLHSRGVCPSLSSPYTKLLHAAPHLLALALPQASLLSDGALRGLPDMKDLSELDLSDCRGLGAVALRDCLPRLKRLKKLSLDGIPEVDDDVLSAAGEAPLLAHLSVRRCQAITDEGLRRLALARRRQLVELAVDECPRVSDVGLEALDEHCRNLQHFSCRRCARLSDAGIARLLSKGVSGTPAAAAGGGDGWPGFRDLCLSGCSQVGTATIRSLIRFNSHSLEKLDISFCRGVSDGAFGTLLDRCDRLRQANVFGCSLLTWRSLYGHRNEAVEIIGAGVL